MPLVRFNYTEDDFNGCSSFCNMLLQGVLGYFFFVYAYQNPDPDNCFAQGDIGYSYRTEDKMHQYNMAWRFRAWFNAGFIICASSLIYSLLVWAFLLTKV